jgi:molecular chaperone GrpE
MNDIKNESRSEDDASPPDEVLTSPDVEEVAPGQVDEKFQAEMETLKDRHLRLQADFDNFRKRTQRERSDVQVRATEELVEALLPVLDHFELGLRNAATQPAAASVREGFQLVYDQLQATLRRFGLMPFEARGVFDPHLHEALTHVPSAEHPADTIVTQTRSGYRLGEKLLRPAQVVVSSGSPDAPAVSPTPGG